MSSGCFLKAAVTPSPRLANFPTPSHLWISLWVRPVRLRGADNREITAVHQDTRYMHGVCLSQGTISIVPALPHGPLLFGDCSWLQSVETIDGKTLGKRGLLFPESSMRHSHVSAKLISSLNQHHLQHSCVNVTLLTFPWTVPNMVAHPLVSPVGWWLIRIS